MQTTYSVGGGWGERKYYRKMKVRLIYSLVPALDLCEYFSSNIIRIQLFFGNDRLECLFDKRNQ